MIWERKEARMRFNEGHVQFKERRVGDATPGF